MLKKDTELHRRKFPLPSSSSPTEGQAVCWLWLVPVGFPFCLR